MSKDFFQKKYNRYMLFGIILTILGVILIVIGILTYVFNVPRLGINLSTLQPVVIDGSKPILLGLVSLIVGSYRLLYKRRAFFEMKESDIQIEIEKYEQNLKRRYYGTKEIRKRVKKLREKLEKNYT